jgi:hypothetical protein
MKSPSRSRIVLPLLALATALMLAAAVTPSAQAEEQHNGSAPGGPKGPASKPTVQAAKPVTMPSPGHPPGPGGHPPGLAGASQHGGGVPQGAQGVQGGARMAHGGGPPARVYGGHQYRGRVAWEGGRWHHEIHNGRDGWWWDVGGVWYYYPEQLDGPPTYISGDYVEDDGYAEPVAEGVYGPPPGAYAPPPPPPAPDPGASAIGGAIVGGLLGGLLTGRASGAAAGAVVGGATGAIAGATAASRPGYYFAQGNCYYRYPSGQYVQADPRACY